MTALPSPVGIIRYGSGWHVTDANASARALLGCERLIGLERGEPLVRAGAAPGAAWPGARRMPCSRYITLRGSGTTRGLLAHFAHAGEEAVLTFEPAEWTLGVLERVHDAVAALDHTGRVVFLNSAAEQLVGIPARVLRGRHLRDIARPLAMAPSVAAAMLRAVGKGRVRTEHGLLTRPDGRRHDIGVTAWPWRHCGSVCGTLVVVTDLTGAADPLPQLANAIWYRVTAVMQHELRNPLQTIQAAAEMARLQSADAAVTVSLNLIEQHVRIISEYLAEQLAPPAGVPYPLGRLSDVVRVECESAALRLSTRRLTFVHRESASEPLVRLHRASMARAFANLFRNAAQARPDATVEIAYAAAADALCCTVTDNGPGLPPEICGDGRFARSDDPAHHLGLAIVASTLEAHGGLVRLDNACAGGARIVLRLPLPSGTLRARGTPPAAGERSETAVAAARDRE